MKNLKLITILLIAIFSITGCDISFSSSKLTDGGIFRSKDHGNTWEQIVFAGYTGKKQNKKVNIDKVNIKELIFAPQDANVLYLSTFSDGLYLSTNQGDEWLKIFASKVTINDFALDYKNNQTIYLTVNNNVYKTIDQGQNWNIIYTDSQPGQIINAIAIDSYDNRRIYIGLSDGRLLRSLDYGTSWLNLYDLDTGIKNIIINSRDTRKIYLTTEKEGIYYSDDLGQTWQEPKINEQEQAFPGSRYLSYVFLNPTKENSLIIATDYGLLESTANITNWQPFKLITPPGGVKISALAVNPQNAKEIYYSVNNVLYQTFDQGQTWINTILPTSRLVSQIEFNPDNPEIIFFATRTPPKEKGGFFEL